MITDEQCIRCEFTKTLLLHAFECLQYGYLEYPDDCPRDALEQILEELGYEKEAKEIREVFKEKVKNGERFF
jgi:hypothetical protein